MMSWRNSPLVLLLVVLAAGCGGGGSSSGSSSTSDWANGFCSAITSWTTSIQSAGQSLRNGKVSEKSLRSAAGDIQSATSTFADDLKGLGKPDTDSGQQAKQSVDQLSSQIKADANEIKKAVNGASGLSGAQKALTTVGTTLSKMSSQISSTLSELNGLDPKGDLQKAFNNADSCKSLVKSGS
jgi:uncharacterized phage infection (PIP) family protein YhgE